MQARMSLCFRRGIFHVLFFLCFFFIFLFCFVSFCFSLPKVNREYSRAEALTGKPGWKFFCLCHGGHDEKRPAREFPPPRGQFHLCNQVPSRCAMAGGNYTRNSIWPGLKAIRVAYGEISSARQRFLLRILGNLRLFCSSGKRIYWSCAPVRSN
jgi:hypothetical protein